MHTPKEKRHLFRGLRHQIEGTADEQKQYKKEVSEHLEQDEHENVLDKGLAGLAEKKSGKEKK